MHVWNLDATFVFSFLIRFFSLSFFLFTSRLSRGVSLHFFFWYQLIEYWSSLFQLASMTVTCKDTLCWVICVFFFFFSCFYFLIFFICLLFFSYLLSMQPALLCWYPKVVCLSHCIHILSVFFYRWFQYNRRCNLHTNEANTANTPWHPWTCISVAI